MQMYTDLFFDLDHTLWDFERNSTETLHELHQTYDLAYLGINANDFISRYLFHNDYMWELYRQGKMYKAELRIKRFSNTFEDFGLFEPSFMNDMAEDYLRICPLKPYLMPNTLETLDYLKEKYKLHIITNGFEEVQHIKMSNTGLDKYFKYIITSEAAQYRKPHPAIFDFALAKSGAKKETSMMIGDSLESDVLGALASGMQQVYFNPKQLKHNEKPTHEIADLIALKAIL